MEKIVLNERKELCEISEAASNVYIEAVCINVYNVYINVYSVYIEADKEKNMNIAKASAV